MPDPEIVFTFDLEDHRLDRSAPARYGGMTRQVLDLADRHGVKGTVFVVGSLAQDDPALIRDIAARGHELALHSWDHVPLHQSTQTEFREETRRGQGVLQDLTGGPVVGYRAPVFSLTSRTLWCTEILSELGFLYSSSVMPAPNPLYGFAEAPRSVFRWTSGLLEFPVPVASLGGLRLAYLGGIYLRYLPLWLVRRFLRREITAVPFTYLHPYDFDADEGFVRIKGASLLTSALLSCKRAGTEGKLRALFANGMGEPLAEQAHRMSLATTLLEFDGQTTQRHAA